MMANSKIEQSTCLSVSYAIGLKNRPGVEDRTLKRHAFLRVKSAAHVPREQQEMEIQANIFAFGVVLLEIISGRPPYCKERGCMINWVRCIFENI